jgi:hypothetical protein
MRGPARENYLANSSTWRGIWTVGGIGEELSRCAEWCSEPKPSDDRLENGEPAKRYHADNQQFDP